MSLQDLALAIKQEELDQNINADQIDLFYENFKKDFIAEQFKINNKKIWVFEGVSKINQYSKYAETFVHIITRELSGGRVYDCNRANRIHWIKPILLAHPCNDIKYYKWKDEKGICKEHYWFYAKDFMVVLKDFKEDVQIVTAFCVDQQEKLRFYERFVDYRDGNGTC